MSTKKLQLVENFFPSDPQVGQVLSIDADGNKTWANQYMMDGTLTPGYQYNSSMNIHLFVIDVTNQTPNLGRYYFDQGTVYIRVVKDGSIIKTQNFLSVKSIQLININPSGSNSGIKIVLDYPLSKEQYEFLFEDNSAVVDGRLQANTWIGTISQYSAAQVDELLNNKLDIPVNTGEEGQVLTLQEDGSTIWKDSYVEATDDEVIDMLVETDMLYAVQDSDGALLTDENNNILLW